MITWPGLTHCRNCGKILEIGEMGICAECESEENKGKNLFEVNGTKYTDNIPNDITISLTKEQYVEYLQQKELIEKLQKENEEYKLLNANIEKANKIIEGKEEYIPKDKIREKIETYQNEIECEKSYLEQGIICEEEYKDRTKVYNSYIFILNKLLEEEE